MIGDGLFAFRRRDSLKSRPAMMGTPSAAKNPGEMTRYCARGSSSPGRVIVTVGAKLQSGTGAGIAPGSNHPEGGLIHARKRINATYDFLVKIDHLLARLSVKDSGNVDGEDVARVHPGLCPLQCEQRSDHHTRAGQQYERCADLRDDEYSLAAFAAGDWNAAAREVQCTGGISRGKRGTKARITAATMASATPTHSRLESTVRSRARTEKRDA